MSLDEGECRRDLDAVRCVRSTLGSQRDVNTLPVGCAASWLGRRDSERVGQLAAIIRP